VVADSYHFHEEQDPGRIRMKVKSWIAISCLLACKLAISIRNRGKSWTRIRIRIKKMRIRNNDPEAWICTSEVLLY
jgi:hypothetical protein